MNSGKNKPNTPTKPPIIAAAVGTSGKAGGISIAELAQLASGDANDQLTAASLFFEIAQMNCTSYELMSCYAVSLLTLAFHPRFLRVVCWYGDSWLTRRGRTEGVGRSLSVAESTRPENAGADTPNDRSYFYDRE